MNKTIKQVVTVVSLISIGFIIESCSEKKVPDKLKEIREEIIRATYIDENGDSLLQFTTKEIKKFEEYRMSRL